MNRDRLDFRKRRREFAMKNIPKLFAPPPPAYATRRDFLRRAGGGFGMLALAGLLDKERLLGQPAPLGANPLASHAGHHGARAKSVIWLFINGGPSHVDTWDYKPELERRNGPGPAGLDHNTRFFPHSGVSIMRSPCPFNPPRHA